LVSGCYVLKQGNKQLALLSDRISTDEALSSGELDAKEAERLHQIKQIREFAKESGLKTGSSYTAFIPMKRKEISFLAYAAKPYEMKLKKWNFPVVGRVPYKGYFKKADRDRLLKKLEADGFETYAAAASAFSFLGWIPDPIYQSMLRRSHLSLAHLLFHELTHKTFWLRRDVPFNENMAEFVAEKLVERYAQKHLPIADLQKYKKYRENRIKYGNWLRGLEARLKKIYALKIPSEEKEKQKQQVIAAEAMRGRQLLGEKYAWVETEAWTNPRILASLVYLPELAPFESAFLCWNQLQNGGTSKFLAGDFLSAIKNVRGEPGKVRLQTLSGRCKR
jgi:predicted aminopeptidase